MLGGEGIYRGSSVLVSGTAGVGKSSIAACCANASCERNERCLYLAFEEAPAQIMRNMRSIGIDFEPWVDAGLLRFHAVRPTHYGLEMHLATIHHLVERFQPRMAIIDPVTNFLKSGSELEARSMLMRLIDFLKSRQITGVYVSLTGGGEALEQTEEGVSSLMDTWLLLRFIESSGERNRGLYVLKARGIAHSNQVREFVLGDRGISIVDVYVGPSGVLTGAARLAQEARERAEAVASQQEVAHKARALDRKRQALEAQILALRANYEAEAEELERAIRQEEQRGSVLLSDRAEMARKRQADATPATQDPQPILPTGEGP
jgi:circadian clock protein KaiC